MAVFGFALSVFVCCVGNAERLASYGSLCADTDVVTLRDCLRASWSMRLCAVDWALSFFPDWVRCGGQGALAYGLVGLTPTLVLGRRTGIIEPYSTAL